MAEFEIIRSLNLLDLDALTGMKVRGSLFDPSYTERMRRVGFLRSHVNRFAAPVLPDDAELAYLPTQVVADFLANWSEPRLDGILYRSVQASEPGRNAVLFHHAAVVEPLHLPEGTEVEAHLMATSEDGEREYSVSETVPPSPQPEVEPQLFKYFSNLSSDGFESLSADLNRREPTLRIVRDRITVLENLTIRIEPHVFDVRRYRQTKRDDAF
jgi:hypothetical protein